MPVVQEGSLILVTGATGYIAAHVVDQLLQRGFRVRGTVRSTEKGEYLKDLFKDAGDRFVYVIVEDLQKENGFDEAVKGVDGILHVASPLYRTAPSGVWKNIIEPAKVGTTSVMYSALRHNPDVKRIVITSSYAAIAEPKPPGAVYTVDDWNLTIKRYALEKGDACEPNHAYFASKAFAEEVAWEFMEREKPKFDITTIIPPLVCGPIIHPVENPGSLNTSSFELWSFLTGKEGYDTAFARARPNMPIVDVRDVAKAHIESLIRTEVGNTRVIVSNEAPRYQEMLDIIHGVPEFVEKFPNAFWGEPGSYDSSPRYTADNKVSKEVLGISYRGTKEIVLDVMRSLVDRAARAGWDTTKS